MSKTVRIDEETYKEIKAYAKQKNMQLMEVIEVAITELKSNTLAQRITDSFNKAALIPKTKEEIKEEKLWENTLMDGIEDDGVDWAKLYEEELDGKR